VWRVLPCRRPDLRILAIIHVLPWVALPIATGVNFPRVKGSPIQRPGRDPLLPPFSVLCTGRFLRCVCGIRLAASTGTPHFSRRLSELAGGPVTAPVGQGLAAALVAAGALMLDVREPDEWQAGHVAQAWLLPMGQVARHRGDLPQDRRIVVASRSGGRSAAVAEALRAWGSMRSTSPAE
jgi:hypothetical protein